MDGYTINTDKNRLDLPLIHTYLSQSYWAKGIPLATVEKSIKNSLCFGVYDDQAHQIGFARVTTDKATFAYLADVFILEAHSGQGIGQWLIKTILQHPDLQGLRRFVLATRDAHSLYQKLGFTQIATPENMMEIWEPDVYTANR